MNPAYIVYPCRGGVQVARADNEDLLRDLFREEVVFGAQCLAVGHGKQGLEHQLLLKDAQVVDEPTWQAY